MIFYPNFICLNPTLSAIRKREVLVKRYEAPDAATFFGDCKQFPQETELSVVHYKEKPDVWDEIIKPKYTDFPDDGILLCFMAMPSSNQNYHLNQKRDK